MKTCARSWGTLAAGWWWCNLPAGHAGTCSCAGTLKPDAAKFFDEQPEAAAAIQRETDRERASLRKHPPKEPTDLHTAA